MKKPRRKRADLPSAWKRIDLLTAIDREIVLNSTLKGAHLMANRKAKAEWAHYRLCALGAARRVLLSEAAP